MHATVLKFFCIVLGCTIAMPVGDALAQPASAEATSVAAQSGNEELAKELSNPLASLVSIPFQFNYDRGLGPHDGGKKAAVNIQPVVPFNLNADWNLISRTIFPVAYQDDVLPRSGSQFGLGDITASLFISPSQPTSDGITWGVGPVLVLPSATDPLLGGEKWGAGPTGVALVQQGPWTLGALANHIWSFAGDDGRANVNRTFVQPFLSYTTPSAWTFSLQSESAYDWTTSEWSVPINAAISKIVKVGQLPISLQGGVGYWATAPDAGPEGFRARLALTVLLPR